MLNADECRNQNVYVATFNFLNGAVMQVNALG